MDALFAVAWLMSVTLCKGEKCKTWEAPVAPYLCQTREAVLADLLPPGFTVKVECRTVHGDKLAV